MGRKKTTAKMRAENLQTFLRKIKSEMMECDYCSFRTSSVRKMRIHDVECEKQSQNSVKSEDEMKFVCGVCDQSFKFESGLKKHMQRHEPPGGFVCSQCNQCFLTEAERSLHKEAVHKAFKCMICSEKFDSEDIFLDHIEKMHDGRDREYVICNECGAHFRQKNQLKLHKESKCGTIRSFVCNVCDSKFLTQNTLNAHVQIHTGVKKHLCNYCGASFLSRGQLQIHERSHTKEKPFQCAECDKAFAHRESLVTHSSLHTGVKPYMCQCCNSQFSCIGNLIKHRRTRPQTCGLPKYTNMKCAPRASTKVPGSLVLKPNPNTKRNAPHPSTEVLSIEFCADEPMKEETGSQMKELDVNSISFTNDQNISNSITNNTVFDNPDEKIFFVADDKEYVLTTVGENSGSVIDVPEASSQIIIVENASNFHDGWDSADDRTEDIIEYSPTDEPSAMVDDVNDFNDDDSSSGTTTQYLKVEPVLNKSSTFEHGISEYYECDLCQKRFNMKKSLTIHFAMAHRAKGRFECNYCDKAYTTRYLRKKHVEMHGPSGELIHKCPCCKLYFATKDDMQQHAQSEHEDRLKCPICNKFYKDLDCIAAHMRAMHRDNPKKKKYSFMCAKCGRKFNSRGALSDHELGDCGRAPIYKCSDCGKALHSQASLKTHQLIHTGDLPFECKFCKKKFRTQGQVKIHERSHSGEKPFKCQQCPKSFAHRESLLTHMSLHTGLKRFMCQCCSSRFSCISNLQAHRRTHKDTCGQLPLVTKAQYGYNVDNGTIVADTSQC